MSYSRRARYSSRSRSPFVYSRSVSRSLSRSRSCSRSCDSSDVENPGNNLYVTGLSPRVTKGELEKHFESEGGKVVDIHLVVDPWTRESRGFGFVTMGTVKDANRCLKYLNRSVLEGRVITVEKARRRRGRTPTPGRYLGLRTTRERRRSPSYPLYGRVHYSPRYSSEREGRRSRSRSYSPYYSRCRRSRSRSYSPHYSCRRRSQSRSYSPHYSRHRRSRSRSRSYSPYYSRRRSRSRSYSPCYSRRRSQTRSYSHYYSRRRSGSQSYSPYYNGRRNSSPYYHSKYRSRSRSYSSRDRSVSPHYRRHYSSVSRSASPVRGRRSHSSSVSLNSRSASRSVPRSPPFLSRTPSRSTSRSA